MLLTLTYELHSIIDAFGKFVIQRQMLQRLDVLPAVNVEWGA
jgi:hypothetical protein